MIAFINPGDGQVMAIYSGDTTSTKWEQEGYVRKTVPSTLEGELLNLARDCKVVLGASGEIVGCVANVNPIQAEESPLSESHKKLRALHDKLKADTITDAEIRGMLRLERGLDFDGRT